MAPELLYDTVNTAKRIVSELEAAGVDEIVTGLGRIGVVGIVRGRGAGQGRFVGLRADMDALPIHEETGAPWSSQTDGVMHACGHDGHMAMLVGAARSLAFHRQFAGDIALIFQPAEEGGAGARAMIEDGLFERHSITEIYGMHNMPQIPLGHFATRAGAMMASVDEFTIVVKGFGGHAAFPHKAVDPLPIVALLVQGLQNIVSRQTDPAKSAVVTVTSIRGGDTYNVIPNDVLLTGTVRCLDEQVRLRIAASIEKMAHGISEAFSASCECRYEHCYPITVNNRVRADNLAAAAISVAGEEKVDKDVVPIMGGEDFAFMLEKIPGAMIFVGNGDSMPVHNCKYDFNDEVIPWGVALWDSIARRRCSSMA